MKIYLSNKEKKEINLRDEKIETRKKTKQFPVLN
jgi:hypothetical protein